MPQNLCMPHMDIFVVVVEGTCKDAAWWGSNHIIRFRNNAVLHMQQPGNNLGTGSVLWRNDSLHQKNKHLCEEAKCVHA